MIDIELDNAISAAMHASGFSVTGYDSLPNPGGFIAASEGGGGGGGNAFALDGIQNSNASYPEAFRVAKDPSSGMFYVNQPVVCDGTNIVTASGGGRIEDGDYYCRIDRDSGGTLTATIQDGSDTEDDTILVVPIATIGKTGIRQHHLGAIVLGGSGKSKPAAFDLEVTKSSTGTKTGKIVRCNFVFDGENKSLSDFTVSGSGYVYLVAKQPAPSGGDGEQPWTFELSESEGEAAEGGRVVNYKLYDLNDFAVTCDYRTTFMELKSPHHVSKFTVSKYEEPQSSVVIEACQDTEAKVTASDGTASATLKASNETAETEVSDGSNSAKMEANGTTAKLTLSGAKTVTVDPDDLEQGNEAKFHKLTVKHADGSSDDEYDVISDKDITIYEGAADERLTGVDLELSSETNLRLKLTFTDKNGNTRDEYSTGLTLKQADVVTGSTYAGGEFTNTKKQLTVIEEASVADEDVFETEMHSAQS